MDDIPFDSHQHIPNSPLPSTLLTTHEDESSSHDENVHAQLVKWKEERAALSAWRERKKGLSARDVNTPSSTAAATPITVTKSVITPMIQPSPPRFNIAMENSTLLVEHSSPEKSVNVDDALVESHIPPVINEPAPEQHNEEENHSPPPPPPNEYPTDITTDPPVDFHSNTSPDKLSPSTIRAEDYDVVSLVLSNEILTQELVELKMSYAQQLSTTRQERDALKLELRMQEARFKAHTDRLKDTLEKNLMASVHRVEELTKELDDAKKELARTSTTTTTRRSTRASKG